MANIKLVALDMDGTLLNSKKELPSDFIPWVKAHNNIRTVIASGRQYYTLLKDFADLKNELLFIAENGGLVFDHDKVIFCDAIPTQEAGDILEQICELPGVTPVIGGVESAYILPSIPRIHDYVANFFAHLEVVDSLEDALLKDTIVKIAVYVDDARAEEMYPVLKALEGNLNAVLSGKSWVDIANKTVNKGAAVQAILDKFDISREEAMAFGDYLNDYELLQVCGESYCMANGHPEMKKIAKYITLSNDEDGVMRILRGI